ncbi:beta-galactosidase, LacZ type [Microbacterium paludicola]|uniref:glycoside hydrolase family 2 TIM barrel-domain containing protein n=1 Tax=Microbacterium paludicola TaxID=300019 RepID=UPI001F315223|nr:glycoside hydrolase family 2 TIM barrel-domain containing protein [Microbacterium paludicola]
MTSDLTSVTSVTDRIADPRFVSENRLPAHSDHRWFRDAAEAATGASSFERSLAGTWKFHYAENLEGTIPGFEDPDVDVSGWDDIRVPGHIQYQGYSRAQYCNVQYPWDGVEDVQPGEVPQSYNPVGSYVTTFAHETPLADGERLTVTFEGAESAIVVWHNGTYVGYATDSFTPSEFDLTDTLVPGENRLAVQVLRFSSGAWLEDQDFYRLSGLFRDVVLRRRPRVHAEDVRVRTEVADDLGAATVRVRVRLTAPGTVTATIAGHGSAPVALDPAGDGELTIALDAPRLWSAEDPYLHDLRIEVRDDSGALTEHIPVAVGIRRFGIEDGVLRINGSRVVLKGVNRHEFGLNGRVMTYEETEQDIRILKAAGVDAVRTSHYPNSTFFYELCDRYGLYVIDEMNLETHAAWDAVVQGRWTEADALPGDRPDWLPALLDRAASMFERDKNHASIVMWSCGNESYGGTNLLAVADWLRSVDDRPVHYEGIRADPRHPQTSDVTSRMYVPAAEVEQYLAEHREKPYILCEYAHAMGNSFGAVDKYVELAYREPLFQGVFVWDFADQGVMLTDELGRRYGGYGGDSGEAPHDFEFCGNGLVLLDRTPTPKLIELKQLYQPLHIEVTREGITVENRHLFTGSDAYDALVTLSREGEVLQTAPLTTGVAPGETASFPVPVELPDEPGEYAIDVSFTTREDAPWAAAGHEVASAQGVFRVGAPARPRRAGAPVVIQGLHNVGVRGDGFSALFSRIHGGLLSYRLGATHDSGRELLRSIPRPNFWHAPTSNERGWGMTTRDGQWLVASRYEPAHDDHPAPTVEVRDDAVVIAYRHDLPTVPASECDLVYTVTADGRIDVALTVRPGEGLSDMPEFGLLMETTRDLDRVRWYGDGPHESYVDRRSASRLGVYEAAVADMLTPYMRPQEAGNRTGVRWAEVTDAHGVGLRLEAESEGGMEFSALPWTPFEVENAAHPVDLPPIRKTVLRPALMRRGVGGDDSWGALTHPEHRLPQSEELTFRFSFQGIGGSSRDAR